MPIAIMLSPVMRVPLCRCAPKHSARSAKFLPRTTILASAAPQDREFRTHVGVPVATAALAAALLAFAVVPEDAMAAKTGGRVGGSGFSKRRAETSQSYTRPAQPQVNYNSYSYSAPLVAPPLVGGYGYGSPFGGFSIMPTFILPVGGVFSSILSFMFLIILVSVVFNVIRSFFRRD